MDVELARVLSVGTEPDAAGQEWPVFSEDDLPALGGAPDPFAAVPAHLKGWT